MEETKAWMCEKYKSMDEVNKVLCLVAGHVKMQMGVCNNAAYYVMLNAIDEAREHPAYRQKAKVAYKQILKEWKAYESRLLYAKKVRMFRLDDMDEGTKKKFAEGVTDRDYYEFWTAIGAEAYCKSKNYISSLAYKYEKSLRENGCQHADIVAEQLTAICALRICEACYEQTCKEVSSATAVPIDVVRCVFGQFSLKRVLEAYVCALKRLVPESGYTVGAEHERNIQLGADTLYEKWLDERFLLNCVDAVVREYDEVFRTKGYQKKMLRELREL